jgi:LysR family hydrogen peroxide-inducible transcriptional activator
MEFHQLRYFVAAAELGSFSRAAERCNVAQPSLSQQVKKLEDELGSPLFDRLGRRVALTDAGRLLLDRASAILASLDDTRRELRDARIGSSGTLAVGAIPTIAPYVLPAATRALREHFADVELVVREDFTENLLAATAAGELDIAIVALPVDDPRLEVEPLFREEILLAVPPGHALAGREPFTLERLRDESFVLLGDVHCLGRQVSSFCLQNEIQPRVSCRTAQLSTALAFVESGLGVAFVPAMARREGPVYRRVEGVGPSRTIAAVWHRNRYQKAAAKAFFEALAAAAPPELPLDRSGVGP